MARQATRKAAAKQSTALTPVSDGDLIVGHDGLVDMPGDDKVIISVAPARGSNSARVQVMDNRVIHQWVTQALADNADSTNLKGRATQRMAAAIMAQVAAWNEFGHPDANIDRVPPLAQVNKSKATRNELLPLLKKAFFDQTAPGTEPNVAAVVKNRRAAENSLLGRAVKVACIIVRGEMTLASFNNEVGQFTVPKSMILLRDHYWTGYMNSPVAPANVLLDGRVYSCSTMNPKTNKETLSRVSASVDTLIRVAIPSERTPQNNESKIDWEALRNKGAPVDWLIDELHLQLCETEADPSDENAPMNGALNAERWGKLSDIAQFSDTEQTKPGFVKDALDKEQASKRA